MKSGSKDSNSSTEIALLNEESNQLRPAEIAYIVRRGDTVHALIVLAADLMQRAVKQTDDTSFVDKLTQYEKNMWSVTKNAVKNWAVEKTKTTLIGKSLNPVQIAKRLSFIYNFVTNSLKVMVSDLITDPKRIRQYFSPKGLWRILADFSSAGYKQAFEQEIRTILLERGLILTEKERQKKASLLLVTALLGVIGTAVVAFVSYKSLLMAFLLWSTAIIAAFFLRTILIVRQLLPFYEELAVVAEQIKRKSKRLTLIKFLLKSVDSLNWLLALIVVTAISLIGLVLAKLAYFEMGSLEIYSYIALTVTNFACVDVFFKGIDLNINDYPTAKAQKELDELKESLEELKPIDSFKEFLESQTYDPQFSKLIAVYGIETLFILA